jgi:hypothetical protein
MIMDLILLALVSCSFVVILKQSKEISFLKKTVDKLNLIISKQNADISFLKKTVDEAIGQRDTWVNTYDFSSKQLEKITEENDALRKDVDGLKRTVYGKNEILRQISGDSINGQVFNFKGKAE